MAVLALKIAEDHLCSAGHFPGNPIIPGALLLQEVLACIADNLAQEGWMQNGLPILWQIKSAKFPQSVRPGDTVQIAYTHTSHDVFRFECHVLHHTVLSGIASIATATPGNFPP